MLIAIVLNYFRGTEVGLDEMIHISRYMVYVTVVYFESKPNFPHQELFIFYAFFFSFSLAVCSREMR